MAIYIELGALFVAIFLIVLIIRFFKDPMLLIANSVLGIILFFLLNAIFSLGILINFWSIAIVALGGVGGAFLVILLHLFGIAF